MYQSLMTAMKKILELTFKHDSYAECKMTKHSRLNSFSMYLRCISNTLQNANRFMLFAITFRSLLIQRMKKMKIEIKMRFNTLLMY